MNTSIISSAARLSLAPARLAGRVAGSLLRQVRGNGAAQERPAPSRRTAQPAARTRAKAATRTPAKAATRTRAPAQPKRTPRRKPLDDVTIARKVESAIFRGSDVEKGKVDVNVAEGVVWLRGEVRTPDLINQLEARADDVPEVRRVENLLHLRKTPAPSRTDTPAAQRKTRRSSSRPEDRAVKIAEKSEEAPAPPAAEPSPTEIADRGEGRRPAPVGSAARGESAEDEGAGAADSPLAERPQPADSAAAERPQPAESHPAGESARQDGPDAAELDKDPAYQPSDPGLRSLKGG
jgi:hypothetical protein